MTRPRSSSVSFALLCGSLAAACGVAGDEAGSSAQPISDVSHTGVKRQSIGNCWTYASAAWMESLHRRHAGADLNLSESYWSYWFWFEQIANSGRKKNAVSTGGSWGNALALALRYGLVLERDFIPEEADAEESSRQKSALAAINASLASGALSTFEARHDRVLVRKELDRAWALGAAVVAQLDAIFGEDASRTLDERAGPLSAAFPGTFVKRASEIEIGTGMDPATGASRPLTLADAMGKQVGALLFGPDRREGPFAWSESMYPRTPAERRQMQIRVQRALHDRQPVIMGWYVDFSSLDAQGRFVSPPPAPGRQGGHMTVLEDYQARDVPGFGTLAAGAPELRPDALAAALDPQASIEFFRVKNSWGSFRPDRGFAPGFPGYHDLYLTYLEGALTKCSAKPDGSPDMDACHVGDALTSFVLPPGY